MSCEFCGEEKCNHDFIGIFPPDMIAMVRNHSLCLICEGYGTYTLPHFKNPRPCPVCRGVGQMNHQLIPRSDVVAEMLLRVFPPRVAPSKPVLEVK